MSTHRLPENAEYVGTERVRHPKDGPGLLKDYRLVRFMRTRIFALVGWTGEVRSCPQTWAKTVSGAAWDRPYNFYGCDHVHGGRDGHLSERVDFPTLEAACQHAAGLCSVWGCKHVNVYMPDGALVAQVEASGEVFAGRD